MKIKLPFLFLTLIFVFAGETFADQLNQTRLLFYQGNAYYSEENFVQAIADYEGALTLGFESGPLYYNLGNAYFKHGSLGKAILNYLRAQKLTPQDADLKSNLDYAQSLIKGGKIIPKRRWFPRMFFTLAGSFSLDKITLVSAILYFALSVLVILAIVARKLRKIFVYIGGLVLVALIICTSLFFAQFYQTVIQKEAVVITKALDSKFEPFDDATTFFTLNEGESVTVILSKKDWVKVRRIDGRQGWVRQSDIELL